MSRRRAQAARAVTLTLASGLLVGCGASPTRQPPTGIDGLTIPTPSATPADFVDAVDNPWFPLRPGATFVYRGVKDGEPTRDVVHVTRATRLIGRASCRERVY